MVQLAHVVDAMGRRAFSDSLVRVWAKDRELCRRKQQDQNDEGIVVAPREKLKLVIKSDCGGHPGETNLPGTSMMYLDFCFVLDGKRCWVIPMILSTMGSFYEVMCLDCEQSSKMAG